MVLVAAALLLLAYCALAAIVARVRPRPVALVAPVALGVLVAYEAAALEALSLVRLVTPAGAAAAQLVPAALWLALVRGDAPAALRRGARRAVASVRGLGVPGLLCVPLLALAALSALRYAPQNWDSMTYHLARVAHWIQHASVGAYRSHIARQNALGPGAEYLLAVLQVIGRSDALANAVQLGCWVLAVWSAPSLARLAGAPASVARWAAPVVAAAPMAVLQASTTQNDLVAGVAAVAIIVAAAPFLHAGRPRWGAGDLVLAAAVTAAALTVKATAILVAAPVLALAGIRALRALPHGGGAGRRLGALAAALAVAAAVAGPYASRAIADRGQATAAFTYPLLGEWGDRALNVLRGTAHHVGASPAIARALGVPEKESRAYPAFPLKLQEDYAGNPLHLALMVLLGGVAAWRWRRLSSLQRCAAAAAGLGWVALHVTLRDNLWFSRLQTPLFVVLPALLAGAIAPGRLRPVRAPEGKKGRRGTPRAHAPAPAGGVVRIAVPAVAAVVLAYGYHAAVGNEGRPPLDRTPASASREASWYTLRPDAAPEHRAALALAERTRCGRLGLFVGEDSWDYPLTWRAMEAGIEVRHTFFDGDAAWPCVVYVADVPQLPAALAGGDWVRASRQVFVSRSVIPQR